MDPCGLCQGPPRGRTSKGVFGQGRSVSAFPQPLQPLPAAPAPHPSVSSFPRPGRSSAPAYSSVMKRPLSRCRRETVTLCVPSRSPGTAAERWGQGQWLLPAGLLPRRGGSSAPGSAAGGAPEVPAARTEPAPHLPASGCSRVRGSAAPLPDSGWKAGYVFVPSIPPVFVFLHSHGRCAVVVAGASPAPCGVTRCGQQCQGPPRGCIPFPLPHPSPPVASG